MSDIRIRDGVIADIPALTDIENDAGEVFREIVEAYVADGDPVGSRTLSRRLKTGISPATGQPGAVRVMITLISFSSEISIV